MISNDKNLSFLISEKVYSLEVLFMACYTFIDKVYVYIDKTKTGEFSVVMSAKDGVNEDGMKKIAGEFHNELLYSALRQKISKNNKQLREAIVFSALFSAQGNSPETLIDNSFNGALDEDINDDAWKDDPLGIAISWEEKRDNKKNKAGSMTAVKKNGTSKNKKQKK